MNGRTAKALRKMVGYSKENPSSNREYSVMNPEVFRYEVTEEKHKKGWLARGFELIKEGTKEFVVFKAGQIMADKTRRRYQSLKKRYTRGL